MTLSTGPEEAEIKRLEATATNIEKNLAVVAVNSDVANALATFLSSLRLRIESLEEKQVSVQGEKQRVVDQSQMAVLVARESALNSQEKEQYWGFLQKDFFSKADFSSLEQFYSNTYDKLTEQGQAQMSHRVWEGVRQQQYQFSELPDTVKEKEAQRLRDAFRAGDRMPQDLNAIPQNDRSEFIDAWDQGKKRESYEVLSRSSFAQSVALSADVELDKTAVGKSTSKDAVIDNEKNMEKPNTQSVQLKGSRQDLTADDLTDISLTATDVKPPLSNHKKQDTLVFRGQ